jgi:hypothetical protein
MVRTTTNGAFDCFVTQDLFGYLACLFHGLGFNPTHGEANDRK